jgi:hypothetical protein
MGGKPTAATGQKRPSNNLYFTFLPAKNKNSNENYHRNN